MKKLLNISIPEPCHKDWQEMTTNQQGKFCNACAKTVVDFTKKSVNEIQSFFIENQGEKVCGRFKKKQLDTITIEIPEQVLFQQVSVSKIFLLALLISMGATLMSCTNNGKKQKINQVIVLDSVAIPEVSEEKKTISLSEKQTIDSISETKNNSVFKETRQIPPAPLVINGKVAFGIVLQTHPRFKESTGKTKSEIKKEFQKKMVDFIDSKIDLKTISEIAPPGKYRSVAQFAIDSLGKITNIRTRANYPIIETEINKIIAELPDFLPATQRHKPVKVKYTMPITFIIE